MANPLDSFSTSPLLHTLLQRHMNSAPKLTSNLGQSDVTKDPVYNLRPPIPKLRPPILRPKREGGIHHAPTVLQPHMKGGL